MIGQVWEKNEARREYTAAIAQGQTAALLEENKPDMFVQRLANIKPLSRVNVRVTYVTELGVDSDTGSAIFILPTSIAPRYGEKQNYSKIPWKRNWREYALGHRVLWKKDLENWNQGVGDISLPGWYPWEYFVPEFILNREEPSKFSFTCEVEMSSKIISIESRTHNLNFEQNSNDSRKATCSLWNELKDVRKAANVEHATHW